MDKAAKVGWPQIKALSRQALAFAFCFAILFAAIAIVEHRFTLWQVNRDEADDLTKTVAEVSNNLFRNGHWSLDWYRQWGGSERSSYLIVTGTEQLVDISGDAGDFLQSAIPVDKYVPRHPTLITTDLGEKWLLDNRRVAGGNVVGGIVADDLIGLKDPQVLLAREMAKYGATVKSAADLNTTILRNFMSGSMVMSDAGKILSSFGAVPLRVNLQVPEDLLDGYVHSWNRGGERYSLLARRVSTDSPSGLIIAFDSVSSKSADESLRFNLSLALAAWLLAMLGYAVIAVRRSLREKSREKALEISTIQLIAQGENPSIEFKSTLRRNLFTNKSDPEIELAVLKTIAAFLNTDGGTLLIGVADDRTILGIASDQFASPDRASLYLTSLIRDKIGIAALASTQPRAEVLGDGADVLRVDVERGATPAYVKTGKGQAFYVRTGPATQELPLSEVHTYIKTHFEAS